MKCPLLHGNIQKETDIEIDKNIFLKSGGCVILVTLNDSKQHSLEPT